MTLADRPPQRATVFHIDYDGNAVQALESSERIEPQHGPTDVWPAVPRFAAFGND